MRTKLGAVYHPRGNPDYAYVVVSLEEPTEKLPEGRLKWLLLWSNASNLKPGALHDESLRGFEQLLQGGEVVRRRR